MMQKILIKDFLDNNKPRERLLYKGSEALSDAELVALLLRVGGKNTSAVDTANLLLKKYKSLSNLLQASVIQLQKNKNVGPAKASILKAAWEITKRVNSLDQKRKQTIKTPKDVHRIMKKYFLRKKIELLYLISLDSQKAIISIDQISMGAVNETLFPIREIIQKALENDAVYLIACHNHPSKDTTPSREDILVTKSLDDACALIGLALIDHVIITDENFHSIKSSNLLKKGGD